MTKQEIIEEIKKLAGENSGNPPGKQRFENETGIKMSEWYPNLWLRWGDALEEAGYSKNKLNEAYDKETLIVHYINLIKELGHFPVVGELRQKGINDRSFPSHSVFDRQLGSKVQRAQEIIDYCSSKNGYDEIIEFCKTVIESNKKPNETKTSDIQKIGYVYLIRHGNRREYKIGKTFNPIRREGEIRLELPDKVIPIHTIKTDDPSGIERYWHTRFADKRKEGEWFELTNEDIRAFKKWKRIV